MRVLFIGGLGRSGTTLLERMLGELAGVCPLGEVAHLWRHSLCDDERCACGERFSHCAFWRAVGAQAFGSWRNVDVVRVLALREAVERTRHIPRLSAARLPAHYQALVSEYAGYYAQVYQAAAQVSGCGVVTDSSRFSSLAHSLRWADGLDLRVVHMVRDSRGVAYAQSGSPDRQWPGDDLAGQPSTGRTPGREALSWNAHNAAFELLRRRGVPVRRVLFERLLAQPAATITDLAEFAGIEVGGLEFLDGATVVLGGCHSAAGDPMRFVTGPVPLHRADDWRVALPPGQRRLVGALTAPLLSVYGYGKR